MNPITDPFPHDADPFPAMTGGPASFPAYAAHILRARALRVRAFGAAAELFSDPAWDILLDLYAAHAQGRLISISSATVAAAVPPTTALRYIDALQRHGLVERKPDPDDRRRQYLFPTGKAIEAIESWFAAI